MLVTALEAQSENVPKWELVTERLLHEELKLREKAPTRTDKDGRKAPCCKSKEFQGTQKTIHMTFLQKARSFQKRLQEVSRVSEEA